MSTVAENPKAQPRYDRYDPWATLYNQTMGPEYGLAQLQWLARVLLPRVPGDAALLDLCCGTGQLLPPLIEQGFKMTGLDGSAQMLEHARRNAPGAELLLDDARTVDIHERFHGIFSTSASLNHIDTIDELAAVFKNVYRALKPGGIFAFDLNHPEQLIKWWRGQPTEGEIHPDFSWFVTPYYDTGSESGRFTVSIYRAPLASTTSRWMKSKQGLYGILMRERFVGLRLRVLQHFAAFEPSWERRDLDFPIAGHQLEAVDSALADAGFGNINLCNIDGDEAPDENHSAHFVCVKSG